MSLIKSIDVLLSSLLANFSVISNPVEGAFLVDKTSNLWMLLLNSFSDVSYWLNKKLHLCHVSQFLSWYGSLKVLNLIKQIWYLNLRAHLCESYHHLRILQFFWCFESKFRQDFINNADGFPVLFVLGRIKRERYLLLKSIGLTCSRSNSRDCLLANRLIIPVDHRSNT